MFIFHPFFEREINISTLHCSLYGCTGVRSSLWDNTGHPCWVLSTRVPGHSVLKLQSDCALPRTHTYTHPHTHTYRTVPAQTWLIQTKTEGETFRAECIQAHRVLQFSFFLVFPTLTQTNTLWYFVYITKATSLQRGSSTTSVKSVRAWLWKISLDYIVFTEKASLFFLKKRKKLKQCGAITEKKSQPKVLFVRFESEKYKEYKFKVTSSSFNGKINIYAFLKKKKRRSWGHRLQQEDEAQ